MAEFRFHRLTAGAETSDGQVREKVNKLLRCTRSGHPTVIVDLSNLARNRSDGANSHDVHRYLDRVSTQMALFVDQADDFGFASAARVGVWDNSVVRELEAAGIDWKSHPLFGGPEPVFAGWESVPKADPLIFGLADALSVENPAVCILSGDQFEDFVFREVDPTSFVAHFRQGTGKAAQFEPKPSGWRRRTYSVAARTKPGTAVVQSSVPNRPDKSFLCTNGDCVSRTWQLPGKPAERFDPASGPAAGFPHGPTSGTVLWAIAEHFPTPERQHLLEAIGARSAFCPYPGCDGRLELHPRTHSVLLITPQERDQSLVEQAWPIQPGSTTLPLAAVGGADDGALAVDWRPSGNSRWTELFASAHWSIRGIPEDLLADIRSDGDRKRRKKTNRKRPFADGVQLRANTERVRLSRTQVGAMHLRVSSTR